MWLTALVCAFVARGVTATWGANAVYYRMLVDSFKDSDGDGLGDLQGAAKQLSYTRALGADAVILSPINAKSLDCLRPGTVSFTGIDPRYGTEDSFKLFNEKSRKLELKVLLSIDVRSISAQSDWFNLSASRRSGYDDWIVWRGDDEISPTEVEGIQWIWNDIRKSYFASKDNETLLNLCSKGLTEAFKTTQCSWLQRGVDGLVLTPDFVIDHDCGLKLVKNLTTAALSCTRVANLKKPITLVETALEIHLAAGYYGDDVGVISNALTGSLRTAPALALALHAELLYCPQDIAPTWLTSSNLESRIATRYGSELVDSINIISLILPGAVIIQQGDELGAADTILEWATTTNCWPTTVAPSAAPFPWDDSPKAGFTTGEPWLPLAPNYRYANAKIEFKNEQSHVGIVKIAAAMRKSPVFGPYHEIKRLEDVLAILRWGSSGSLLVVANLKRGSAEVELSRIAGLPSEMTVAISAGGSSLSSGAHISVNKVLKLGPGETVLLAGPPRHCGGPGPVDKIANKLSEGWQKINKYFDNI